jgi:hypothetical protein
MSDLIGKGLEILKYIAENEPCTQYAAREASPGWSSRTVWKQFNRLETDRMIQRTSHGYQVTDWGFSVLIPRLKRSEMKKILQMAIEKYPGGHTERQFGALLRQVQGKVDLERKVGEYLKKPNIFLVCRTDKKGRIAWTFLTCPALDLETGRPNLKVMKRLPSKIRPRWRTINLR